MTNTPVDGPAATPTKKAAPRAPRGSAKKATPRKKKGSSDDDENEDDDELIANGSPSKSANNKVLTGRVVKARAATKPKGIYAESDDEEDENEVAIKNEPNLVVGNGHSNGNNRNTADAMDEDDVYYAAEDYVRTS